MANFHETTLGKSFMAGTMPDIAESLRKIGHELRRANDLEEKKQELEAISSAEKSKPNVDMQELTKEFTSKGDKKGKSLVEVFKQEEEREK